MQGQGIAAEAFRVGCLADFLYTQDIAFEMRPAELALALVVLQVTGTAVAAKDSGEYFTEQLNEHLGPARESDLIEDEVGRHQSPEPAFFSARPVSRLVAVDNRFMRQLPLPFRAGLGDRFAGFFPRVLNTAQTERLCPEPVPVTPAPRGAACGKPP